MQHRITIFHNPACGTSRTVLDLLLAAGYQPEVVEYLETGWPAGQLERLLAALGVDARALLRRKEALAAELGLLGSDATSERILQAMQAHPVLVERPIVVSPSGVVLARPVERVWAVLPDRNNEAAHGVGPERGSLHGDAAETTGR